MHALSQTAKKSETPGREPEILTTAPSENGEHHIFGKRIRAGCEAGVNSTTEPTLHALSQTGNRTRAAWVSEFGLAARPALILPLNQHCMHFPRPGIEPGPPGREPGILTTRPSGNYESRIFGPVSEFGLAARPALILPLNQHCMHFPRPGIEPGPPGNLGILVSRVYLCKRIRAGCEAGVNSTTEPTLHALSQTGNRTRAAW
ncbi:unnamed protein product, partial [Clavelina lepadiformis]